VGVALTTPRLLLRGWRPEDLEPFARINADQGVARFTNGRPLTPEESAEFVERIRAGWAERGYGLWAMEHLPDGAFVGFVGFSHHRWYPGDVEVGWRLDPLYWNRGLATEGAAAVLRHGFTKLGLARVISIIHRDNVGSRRVAEKNGLSIWKEAVHPKPETGIPLPIVVYEIDRPTWQRTATPT
jgi:RimJ/RimL family protein N-acetyltransferase